MNRNELLEGIFTQFDKSANDFCLDTAGLFCEISNEYKGITQVENLKRKTAKIYYNAFAIEFVYNAHGIMSVVNSILSCNVYLDKSEQSMGIPLAFITDYCDMDVDTPLCIPFITNEQAMSQAFECIGDVVKTVHPDLAEKCCNSKMLEVLLHKFSDELQCVFQVNLIDLNTKQQRCALTDFFAFRLSTGAFHTALRGKYAKASKQLGRGKQLTGYEKRMQRIWLKQKQDLSAQLPAVYKNAKAYSGSGTSKIEFEEFFASAVSWFVLCPVFSIAYLGIYALLVWIEGLDSVYLLGPQYYFPICFFAGFLTAIATSWFTRRFFFKRLFKKDYAQYCEMESVQNLNALNKLMKIFLAIVVAGCVAYCLLQVKCNLNFKQDGFVDNTKFLSITGEYYAYSEVEYIYYKTDRGENGLGETLAYPSYVIVLRDGREIDLFEYADFSDYAEELIGFFREKGLTVKEETS